MFKERFIQAPTEDLYEANKENISDESIVFHEEINTISVGDVEIEGIPEPNDDTKIGSVLAQTDEGLEWIYKEVEPFVEETVIRINQTIDDPYKMITGQFGKDGTPSTNVVSWIRANSHRYVGSYDATNDVMNLKQLDDNNGWFYADGTDATADQQYEAGNNVFVKLPTFWYKGVEPFSHTTDITDVYFRRTKPDDETGWWKWNQQRLIGAFKGSIYKKSDETVYKLFSLGYTTQCGGNAMTSYIRKAQRQGSTNFNIISWVSHRILSLLYLGYYGNTNCRHTLGIGRVWTNPSQQIDGVSLGMRDTTEVSPQGDINFWGVCNVFGGKEEFIQGISTWQDTGVHTIHAVDGIPAHTYEGIAWKQSGTPDRMVLGQYLDFIPKNNLAPTNYQIKWCCGVNNLTDGNHNTRFWTRGYGCGNDSDMSIWQYWSNIHNESGTSSVGARLEYCGPIKIIK